MAISGTIGVLLRNSGIPAIARANGLTPFYLKSAGEGGATFALFVPHVQFNEPAEAVSTPGTIERSYEWMARHVDGDGPVTATLVNSYAGVTL